MFTSQCELYLITDDLFLLFDEAYIMKSSPRQTWRLFSALRSACESARPGEKFMKKNTASLMQMTQSSLKAKWSQFTACPEGS